MNIFITGATGYIGFAVASALAARGHQVFGLARSKDKAKKLAAAEIYSVLGTMENPSSYLDIALQCQVWIHCAAEWSEQFHQLDRQTVETFIKATAKAEEKRTIIYTSGVWLYGDTKNVVDENSPLNPPALVTPRVETEELLLNSHDNHVSTIIVRPGCVYGGQGGLTAAWFDSAMKNDEVRIVGDGHFQWSMVHIQDLADAYVRIAESTFTKEIFNVTDHSHLTILKCAEAASYAAGKAGKVKTIAINEAAKTLGLMAECLALNQQVDSSKITRLLGWQPKHAGFVNAAARYFRAWQALST